MIVKVFYTEISPQVKPDVYDKLLQSFPEKITERILHYTNERERNLRITGKALLAYALKKMPGQSATLEQYDYSPTNQPILLNSHLKFSISHSGNMVVCAITESHALGVDVERTKPVKLELMKFYFDRESWFEIINAPDVYAEFYRHWTMREAAIKASGLEIDQMELSAMVPEDHTIQVRNEIFHCRMLPVRYDYTICAASDKEIEDLEINRLSIEELL
jgi:4'-phosphopantetheinyl transferase